MSDTLRPNDTKVDVVTTCPAKGLARSDKALARGAPLIRAFIFYPKPEKHRGLVRSWRSALWVVLILSHDAAVCH